MLNGVKRDLQPVACAGETRQCGTTVDGASVLYAHPVLRGFVLMRRDGVKRARDELDVAQPFRGHLHMRALNGVLHARITPTEDWHTVPVQPALQPAEVFAIKGRGMMIRGLEYRDGVYTLPQAWWVTLD